MSMLESSIKAHIKGDTKEKTKLKEYAILLLTGITIIQLWIQRNYIDTLQVFASLQTKANKSFTIIT